jgi:hypothetical protein
MQLCADAQPRQPPLANPGSRPLNVALLSRI